jgi:hypothetical protein
MLQHMCSFFLVISKVVFESREDEDEDEDEDKD